MQADEYALEEAAREALRGAVDLHVHPGPSPFPRRIGIVEAAQQAAAMGFRAIVVKSHHHSMVTDVLASRAALEALPVRVFAGIALNNQVGGLNPYAVETALAMGGKVVWFPTIAAAKHIRAHHHYRFPSSSLQLRPDEPVPLLTEDGRLRPQAYEVLELIKRYDAVLATGHLDSAEVDVLLRAARGVGVQRVVVNHPNFVVEATPEVCREWARLGAYIEHSLCMYDDRSAFYHWPLEVLLTYVRQVGPERTLLVSDLGQANNPLPTESYLRLVMELLRAGMPRRDVELMVGGNAAQLLGL